VIIWYILLLLGAYLLGSVPMAYLVARWSRGIDIRQYGSGNVGASNVLATGSRWQSIGVVIFDLGKGVLPVYIAQIIDLQVYQQVTIGLAAIAGHNWPVFLRFNGGRGLLTTLGVVLILPPSPWLGLVLLAFTLAWLPFGQLAFGTIIALFLLPLLSWFLSHPFRIDQSLALSLGFAAILLLTVARRLSAPKSAISASVPQGQLIVNRLFFDRDIRDRAAWIKRKPAQ
jgi:glycerol-3-phosphate acyltransferase PlsY